MAGTYSVTDNAVNIAAGGKAFVQEAILDFSTTNLAATETIDVFEVPANTLVVTAGIQLVTAGSAAGTLDMGDGTAADTWVADIDADSATAGLSSFGTTPKAYTTADTIDVAAVTEDFDGKIRVVAVMMPLGPSTADGAAFA